MNVMLKNRDIDNGLGLIKTFNEREGISIKVSFAIAKTCRRLREVIEVMQEERKKLITKHQATDDEGNRILVEGGGGIKLTNSADFSDDFDELMKQETEVDVHQIDFDLLEKMKDREGKKVIPTPAELEGLLLLKMIKDEDDEDKEEEDED